MTTIISTVEKKGTLAPGTTKKKLKLLWMWLLIVTAGGKKKLHLGHGVTTVTAGVTAKVCDFATIQFYLIGNKRFILCIDLTSSIKSSRSKQLVISH